MKTRITELLGIKYPIIQGAMNWVSFPPLVAAVSNAGGLGILGAASLTPEGLRENIRQIKSMTDKPFGVNILSGNPILDDLLDVMIAEKIKVCSYGIGNPKHMIERMRQHGIISMPTVASVKQAEKAEADNVDVVIAEGMESGGHVGYLGTMALVTQVTPRLKVPVVAAGGFADSRGLIAALALGAEGISMGTRFIVTQESPVPMSIKQTLLGAKAEETVITGNITGIRCRVYKNRLAEEFLRLEQIQASKEEMGRFGSGKMRQAFVEGDTEMGSIMAGEIVGMIDDIPTCQELLDRIVGGAEAVLGTVREKLGTPSKV